MPEPTDAARAIRLGAIRERDRATYASPATGAFHTEAADRRWLLGEVDRLTAELAEEEADRAQAFMQEEGRRLDVEDRLAQAERTIRELRDKIEYWEMGR